MHQSDKPRSIPRIHAYAASFGEDFARDLILASTTENGVVLDPFVGAGTTALESILSNRNAIGIDVDPIACLISQVTTSRFDVPYFKWATNNLRETLVGYRDFLTSNADAYQKLGPGSTFPIGSRVFQVPDVPAIAYWFAPSHMATLTVAKDTVSGEPDPLVRRAFQVAISSAIIRKWPNTLSYAMDIDHSRPHRPRCPREQTIEEQFYLFDRILTRVRDAVLEIQKTLAIVDSSATIIEGDVVHELANLDSDSVEFVLTSPPYLNAIDYPRAHKFSQWWLSPEKTPLGRSEYLGLRQAKLNGADDCSLLDPSLFELLLPFKNMPVYRNVSRYLLDLASVLDQLHRVVKVSGKVVFVVANNVISGTVFPVSEIIEHLLKLSGFSSVRAINRTIKNTRRRYPYGINGFAGPMKDEFLITGTKLPPPPH